MDFDESYEERINTLNDQIKKLSECEHIKTEIRSRGMHYGLQCMRCGSWVGGWIKHSEVQNKDSIQPYDDSLCQRYYETKSILSAELVKIRDERVQEERDTRTGEYKEYLLSDAWRDKRQRVLARCGGMCEGCRKYRATEVHHLTYKHVGNEFLFELVGLCKKCHEAIHNREQAA